MKPDIQQNIEALYERQLQNWTVAQTNYAELDKIIVKHLSFRDHVMQAQWNPRRIISSAAKTDRASIQRRPCFLCFQNRPLEQEGIVYKDKYIILINPYPVFHRHLTIASLDHTAQRIDGNFGTMLLLARDLTDYSIIYNGPSCGASAPDHFHFQAVPKLVLPVNEDFRKGNKAVQISESKGLRIYAWDDYPAQALTLISSKLQILRGAFGKLYELMDQMMPSPEEPMMNIIASFDAGEWMVHVFPRKKHRPRQYFADDLEKILLSPASIDMCGVLVIPREADFFRINENDVVDIFNQVCVDEAFIRNLIPQIGNEYV